MRDDLPRHKIYIKSILKKLIINAWNKCVNILGVPKLKMTNIYVYENL